MLLLLLLLLRLLWGGGCMGSFSAVSFQQFTRTMDGIACHAGGWPGASAAAPVPSPAAEALALSYALIHASVGSGMGSKTSGLVPSARRPPEPPPGGADVVCDNSAAYRATISGFTAADEDEDDEDEDDEEDEEEEEEGTRTVAVKALTGWGLGALDGLRECALGVEDAAGVLAQRGLAGGELRLERLQLARRLLVHLQLRVARAQPPVDGQQLADRLAHASRQAASGLLRLGRAQHLEQVARRHLVGGEVRLQPLVHGEPAAVGCKAVTDLFDE